VKKLTLSELVEVLEGPEIVSREWILGRVKAAQAREERLSTWAEEVYLFLSDTPSGPEKLLMSRLRAIRKANLAASGTATIDREARDGGPVGAGGVHEVGGDRMADVGRRP
jgi:hypothetical protein